jgi:hypothetical protein
LEIFDDRLRDDVGSGKIGGSAKSAKSEDPPLFFFYNRRS